MNDPRDPWDALRRLTQARIALGRSGQSLPTKPMLEFALAHAQARDAVHAPFDHAAIAAELIASGFESITVQSAASDRAEYLLRPDRGRRLSVQSAQVLREEQQKERPDVVFVIADGLSAVAAHKQAVPMLRAIQARLANSGGAWTMAPIIVAQLARVALGDEIGHLLGAQQVVMLIGERPGLSSPDSLGIYLTYAPEVGRHDAQRNCVSNVRPEGLSFDLAAFKLHYLMENARRLKLSGVQLKDDSDRLMMDGAVPPALLSAS